MFLYTLEQITSVFFYLIGLLVQKSVSQHTQANTNITLPKFWAKLLLYWYFIAVSPVCLTLEAIETQIMIRYLMGFVVHCMRVRFNLQSADRGIVRGFL